MYLDTDVVLAELKADDWLASDVDLQAIPEPVTSVATCIEVRYVLEGEWGRDRLTDVPGEIRSVGIDLVPLAAEHVERGGELERTHQRLNWFDAIHLGIAAVRDETIVSTDTLFPEIEAIDHVDPRELS